MLYPINEIFYSIQGEGSHAGKPAVFVRLSGCNLNCSWCDTDHSKNYESTEKEIIETVKGLWPDYTTPMMVLTGGEPTIHDLYPLLDRADLETIYVAIETNGTNSHILTKLEEEVEIDWITVSPKKISEVSLSVIRIASEIKIVFESVEQIKQYETRLELCNFKHQDRLYIQPCSQNYQPAINFVLKNPQWRLSLQTQKIIGVR